MDLLPWHKLNKFIQIHPTKSKFYNRYLYKLGYDVIGAHLISVFKNQKTPIRSSRLTDWDIDKLNVFFLILKNKDYDLRFRTEGSSLSIFGTSEQELYDLAQDRLYAYRNSLRSVTRVASEQDLAHLQSNCVLMSKGTDFKYKVTVRTSWRNTNDRQNLGNYLNSIRSEVKISDFLLHHMMNQYKYLHSCYFYVNDPQIVSMISLIAPTVIKRVQEVVIT